MTDMKRIAVVIVAILVAVGLSGCDQLLPEPLAFTLVDGRPVVRTCIPLEVTGQSISVYSSEEDYESEMVWFSAGRAAFEAGTEIELGAQIEGLGSVGPADDAFLSSEFKFEMDVESEEGGNWTATAVFSEGDLAEGRWIDSRGEELTTPCTHEPCSPQAACFNNWPEPTGLPTEVEPTFRPSPTPTSSD
jgi:hypothetical protein